MSELLSDRVPESITLPRLDLPAFADLSAVAAL
jgi:hypothetical protein